MWPPSRAGSKPCVGTGNRGPGPVMPAPVPPRRKRTARSAVRRAWTENPRRGPGYGEKYPDLVTLEPAEDDEEVFGDAWPMIVEWRELKDVHPNEGKGLGWLRTEERFLALELALLEDHGMTLPPARFPLRGFDRNGQVNWRQTAFFDTRRALRKRELLNRLSLGLLWR